MFGLLFGGMFLLVAGIIVYQMACGVAEWNRNNHSPVEERRASVVGKREEVHHHNHTDANGAMHMSTSTTYYATFEMDDGIRMELRIKGREYGMLAEGDFGTLTYQGTRYLGFQRK